MTQAVTPSKGATTGETTRPDQADSFAQTLAATAMAAKNTAQQHLLDRLRLLVTAEQAELDSIALLAEAQALEAERGAVLGPMLTWAAEDTPETPIDWQARAQTLAAVAAHCGAMWQLGLEAATRAHALIAQMRQALIVTQAEVEARAVALNAERDAALARACVGAPDA